MNAHPQRALPIAAALAAFVLANAASAQSASPWAKVPALPTACYQTGDPFVAKLEAAQTAAHADLDKQQAINQKIKDDFQSIDPMEMASRMQQWMMDNPEAAMKYAQGIQQAGEEIQTRVPEDGAKKQALVAERGALFKRYQAALAQAYTPATDREKALAKKLETPDPSWRYIGESGIPDFAFREQNAINRQKDGLYQAVCPQWWGAAGPMAAYLKKYREWLVKEHIPFYEELDSHNVQNFAIMNTPAASYRSTASFDGVVEYLDVVSAVYRGREHEPICAGDNCKDIY